MLLTASFFPWPVPEPYSHVSLIDWEGQGAYVVDSMATDLWISLYPPPPRESTWKLNMGSPILTHSTFVVPAWESAGPA